MHISRALAGVTVATAALLAGCQAPSQTADTTVTATTTHVVEETAPAETVTPVAQETSITIRSIGDILPHSDAYGRANALAGYEGFDFAPMFAPVRAYMENADITTANMEVPVAGLDFGLSGYPTFNSPPEMIDALRDAGVDVVNNATNHTLDQGGAGAEASVRNIRDRGMMYTGGYDSWEDKAAPRIIEANGIKVGFIAYTYGTNGIPVPEGQEYLVSLIDYEAMRREIAELDAQVDATVAMIHMGEEYEYFPVDFQRETAAVAREAGADYILGGHPHVVEPFLLDDESSLTWFSHGNFLHGQWDERTKIGGIGEVTLTKRADGSVVFGPVRFMPTFMIGPPMSYEHQVIPLAEAWDYVDVAGWQQALRERLGDVEVVDYLD
ncbi:CapA family protein [Corynebacterium aquatimens]|uniref:CapA family protein n=1 Tax=Corynebacterium aquatimens TaxID=1190508 RepID=UPI002541ECF4|nr:CapA family protein [Corynebacterium aquatimens]QYH18958.1 CapA family protein [Corynebacterium aquatimens]